MARKRVIVGMSGGVDSCVAAALLVERGFDVVGVTMRLWTVDRPEAFGHQHCCSAEDSDDAREVAGLIGIPYYVLNFEQEFRERVVDTFVAGYASGRTPNPCQSCNEHLKFRALMVRATSLAADLFATGHYARICERNGAYDLETGVDGRKDQSYFLYTLGQPELARLLFPLGDLVKDEVRAIARRLRLPVADKPDSEEICFIPDNDYRRFLRERVPSSAGEIVDTTGLVIGYHDGIMDFTVGQRRGLGAFGDRRFVLELQPAENRVVIGSAGDLRTAGLKVGQMHWVAGMPPEDAAQVTVKVRHGGAMAPARLHHNRDGAELAFDEPQRAVSPGQAAVIYDGRRVLGGGVIDSSWH